nr:MAG TPA: hypothetical protein [Caudoviricetes sp.]
MKENKKGEIYSPLIFYKEGDIWKKNATTTNNE